MVITGGSESSRKGTFAWKEEGELKILENFAYVLCGWPKERNVFVLGNKFQDRTFNCEPLLSINQKVLALPPLMTR